MIAYQQPPELPAQMKLIQWRFGTVSWIERKGPSLVIVLGAPAWSAAALATEVWTATGIAKPAARPIKVMH